MRQRLRLVGVSAVALAAAGCFWPSPGAGPSRTAHNVFEDEITPETVADLEEIWAVDADPPGIVSGVVTSNRAVHFMVRSTDGFHLYGIDPTDGSQIWQSPVGSSDNDLRQEFSLPIFTHDAIWVGYGFPQAGGSFQLGRFDPDSGEETRSGFGLVDGVRGSRYVIRGFSVSSSPPVGGLLIGVRDLDDPDAGWIAPIYFGDMTELGNPGLMTLGHNAIYQAGNGFFGDDDGDTTTGNGLRSYAIEGPGSCAEDDEPPCLPTWAVELDGARATTPVVARQENSLDDATIFTGTDAGTVYAVDATNGETLWTTSVGSTVGAEPALADGRLYVPAGDGLTVLDAATGDIEWEGSLDGLPTHFQPAVAGGVVFVATDD